MCSHPLSWIVFELFLYFKTQQKVYKGKILLSVTLALCYPYSLLPLLCCSWSLLLLLLLSVTFDLCYFCSLLLLLSDTLALCCSSSLLPLLSAALSL